MGNDITSVVSKGFENFTLLKDGIKQINEY
jgi:hypothetical protein